MAAKKKPHKRIEQVPIENLRIPCCVCGVSSYESWNDFIVDAAGHKMHRSCRLKGIEQDDAQREKLALAMSEKYATGESGLSEDTIDYADYLYAKFMIELEIMYPGLDMVRYRATLMNRDRPRIMRYRDHPLWLEFMRTNG